MNSRMLANFIGFQLGWFACVLMAARGQPMLGIAVALVMVAVHLYMSPQPVGDLRMMLAVTLLGGMWDSLLTGIGILQFSTGMLLPWLAPHWIFAMWLVFATTLNTSLRWLHGRYLLAMVLGAAGGPLAYNAGAALNAVTMPDALLANSAMAAGWGLLMPALVKLAEYFDRPQQTREYAS